MPLGYAAMEDRSTFATTQPVGAIINRPGRQWRDRMGWVLLVTFKFSLSRPSPMGKVFGCPKR